MATAHRLPTAATPVERILSRFDRQQLADFIEVAISLLDVANDDPDLEDSDPCYFQVDAKGNPMPGSECFRTEDDEPDDFDDDPRMDMEEDDPPGGNSEDEGEAISEQEPLAPLTLNPDSGQWLDWPK